MILIIRAAKRLALTYDAHLPSYRAYCKVCIVIGRAEKSPIVDQREHSRFSLCDPHDEERHGQMW